MSFRNQSWDDRDGALSFSGSWFRDGTYNASRTGQTGTLSSTNDPNASVKFNFPTPARAFYVYGIKRSRGGSYGICIDCDPNQQDFIPIDGVDPTDDGKNPPTILFSRTFDELGSHVIILRNEPDPRFPNNNSQLALDRIDLEVQDPNASAGSSQGPSPTNSAAAVSGGKTNVPAIVGGIIGGLVVLGLIGLAIFLLWRRNRSREGHNVPGPGMSETGIASASGESGQTRPYLYQHSESEWSQAPFLRSPPITASTRSSSARASMNKSSFGAHPRNISTSTSSQPSSNAVSSAGSQGRAVDAGPVTDSDILPPEYGNWAPRSS